MLANIYKWYDSTACNVTGAAGDHRVLPCFDFTSDDGHKHYNIKLSTVLGLPHDREFSHFPNRDIFRNLLFTNSKHVKTPV